MENNEYTELGTIELTDTHHHLINKFADIILDGTFEQAVKTFTIIFERQPETDLEMEIFKALCEQKIKERTGDFGIKGVLDGGKVH